MPRYPTESYRKCIVEDCPTIPHGLLIASRGRLLENQIQIMFCPDHLEAATVYAANNFSEDEFMTRAGDDAYWLKGAQEQELQIRD